jgi:hypothetical protein
MYMREAHLYVCRDRHILAVRSRMHIFLFRYIHLNHQVHPVQIPHLLGRPLYPRSSSFYHFIFIYYIYVSIYLYSTFIVKLFFIFSFNSIFIAFCLIYFFRVIFIKNLISYFSFFCFKTAFYSIILFKLFIF